MRRARQGMRALASASIAFVLGLCAETLTSALPTHPLARHLKNGRERFFARFETSEGR